MTNRDEQVSLRRQILDILAQGKFTTREVADQLGVQSRAEVEQARKALDGLAQTGQVDQKFSKTPKGWVKVWIRTGSKITVQQLIWRACCLKSQKGQPFTAADLAVITPGETQFHNVSRDYLRRYLRWLKAEKFLIELARRGNAAIYTVPPGKEKKSAPHWNRRAQKRAGEMAKGEKGEAEKIHPSPPLAKGGEKTIAQAALAAAQEADPLIYQLAPRLFINHTLAGRILDEMEAALQDLLCGFQAIAPHFEEMRGALGLPARSTGWKPALPGETHEPENRG